MDVNNAIMYPQLPEIMDIHNSNMGIYNWIIDVHNYAYIK